MTIWMFMLIFGTAAIEDAALWIALSVMYIGNYLCARRNMKVLEKQISEDTENTER